MSVKSSDLVSTLPWDTAFGGWTDGSAVRVQAAPPEVPDLIPRSHGELTQSVICAPGPPSLPQAPGTHADQTPRHIKANEK